MSHFLLRLFVNNFIDDFTQLSTYLTYFQSLYHLPSWNPREDLLEFFKKNYEGKQNMKRFLDVGIDLSPR